MLLMSNWIHHESHTGVKHPENALNAQGAHEGFAASHGPRGGRGPGDLRPGGGGVMDGKADGTKG